MVGRMPSVAPWIWGTLAGFSGALKERNWKLRKIRFCILRTECVRSQKKARRISGWAFCLLVAFFPVASAARAQERLALHHGWMIQSSAKVGTDGAAIASAGYHPAGWYAASVPSTVVGTLVDDGLYRDPFFGMNLRELPGTTFPVGANFVHTAMDPQSPYAVPWWYRTPSTFRPRCAANASPFTATESTTARMSG